MELKVTRLFAVIVATLAVSTGAARAQLGAPFSGTLKPIVDNQKHPQDSTGTGFLYSVLDYYPEGPKLMVNGTFEGMSSAAISAHLHRATVGPDNPRGPTPGPEIFDLVVSTSTNGTLNGSFWITEEQAEELREGWYYVQISSRTNPSGDLRGWLVQGFLHAPAPEDSP